MSLVFVSPGGTEGGGGMGTVTRGIVAGLRARHPATPVIVLDPRGDGSVFLFPFHLVASLARLMAVHLKGRIDILHLNVSERMSIPRKAIFLLYGRLFGIPVVLHHHGAEFIPEYEKRSGAYRRLVRWAVNAAQCNIVLGRLWEDFLSRDLGVPKDRIVLLYNAVSDPGRPAPRVEKPGPLRLLILANLSARKGVGELLQAMKVLTGSERDLTLTLAGGGEVDAFRARAEGLGIGKRCRFTGWIPATDAAKLWAETDLFVLPSHHEGLPMAILEALSQSVPVVATPVGSIPEVLTDGTDCRLVPPGDTAALTRTLASLQDDPGERRRLGEAGRLLFERQFALDQYIDRLLRLYGHLQPPELEGKRA